MTKEQEFAAAVDLKQFFEASMDALQNDKKSTKVGDHAVLRNLALIQRADPDAMFRKRAMADATKALSALWKTKFKEAI
ncbi:MAG: hypothetical protein ACRD23_13115 [Terriglobales bacterium]